MGAVNYGGEVAGDRALLGPSSPLHQGGRGVRGHTGLLQGLEDGREGRPAHQDDQGTAGLSQVFPRDGGFGFVRILAAADDGKAGGNAALGQGDAGVGGGGDGGGDAGDDNEGDVMPGQELGFLAAAAKDEGVAAFEPGDSGAGGGPVGEELVDFVLGEGLAAAFFADKD